MSLVAGIITATGTIIGFQLGRGRFDKAKLYSKKMLQFGILFGICAGIVIFCISGVISAHANLTSQSANYLKLLLRIFLVYLPFKAGSSILASGIINAGGQAKKCLIGDLIFTWGITISLLLIGSFVLNWPVEVIFILVNIDELLKFPYFCIIYKKGSWLNNLTRPDKN